MSEGASPAQYVDNTLVSTVRTTDFAPFVQRALVSVDVLAASRTKAWPILLKSSSLIFLTVPGTSPVQRLGRFFGAQPGPKPAQGLHHKASRSVHGLEHEGTHRQALASSNAI
jgi:hypothetical protein